MASARHRVVIVVEGLTAGGRRLDPRARVDGRTSGHRRVVQHWEVMEDSEPAVSGAPVVRGVVATAAQAVRPNAKLIALLSIGHFVVDLNQGSLPALLPFLKSAHQLSYSAVATIVLAANVASSIVQPLFGYFADRASRRWMLPVSVLLTGGGFGLMGLAAG